MVLVNNEFKICIVVNTSELEVFYSEKINVFKGYKAVNSLWNTLIR